MNRLSLRRRTALLLALLACPAVAPPLGARAASDDPILSVAPAGAVNLTAGAETTVTACRAQRQGSLNSYEKPTENWCLAMLTDGKLGNGWSTDPYDRETDLNAPVALTVRLAAPGRVRSVALFRHGAHPDAYTVSLSEDGVRYETIGSETDAFAQKRNVFVYEADAPRVRFVRVEVTRRAPYDGGRDGALVQLAEIAVFGQAEASMRLDRPALALAVGETDALRPILSGLTAEPTLTFRSSRPDVVTVDETGRLAARTAGEAVVTVSCAEAGRSVDCPVTVTEEPFSFNDNILISVFWPPTPDYVNDEQYRLLADAEVDWVMSAGEESLASPEMQRRMLALCAKYGLGMTVRDPRFGSALLARSPTQIAEQTADYRHVPAADGFFLCDEPYNPNVFLNAYRAIKSEAPRASLHLNFLPLGSYGTAERYRRQLYDWCAVTGGTGYPTEYLMFDRYPFGLQPGTMDQAGFLENLQVVRDVGRRFGVKTALYIQTVCQEVGFRRPTDSEIRYEMYLSLAYGFKQLSFFTWFTPTNRSEPFRDGIISPDGRPNAHYGTVKTLNREIHRIGPILARCDAEEIGLNGERYGQPAIPEDFPFRPADRRRYTASLLRDRETGRNYLMIVNNLFNRAQSMTLTFDDRIRSLSEVSREDGALRPLAMDGQDLSLTLAAGDAILLALPEGYDYRKPAPPPQPGENLLQRADARLYASSSAGEDGCFVSCLCDGRRLSDGSVSGFRAADAGPGFLLADLGAVLPLNRADLYPAGDFAAYGRNFPNRLTLSVSEDGETYREVASAADAADPDGGLTLRFDRVSARFVRLDFSAGPRRLAEIGEWELYDDDGSVPPAPRMKDLLSCGRIVAYEEGGNLALRAPVLVSSSVPENYRAWNWAADFVNDGDPATGWTSNVGRHQDPHAVEYVVLDFGDLFDVESTALVANGFFPLDYTVALSEDGRTWTVIGNVRNAPAPAAGERIVVAPAEPVRARFLRVKGTRLRGDAHDGFLMQLGEIEAYGRPVCDRTALGAAVAAYRDRGLDESEEAFAEAARGWENPLLTQTQADDLLARLSALLERAPEPPTDVPTLPPDAPTEPPAETEGPAARRGCASLGGAAPLLAAAAALACRKPANGAGRRRFDKRKNVRKEGSER